MIYFRDIQDIPSLRKRYKELVFLHHPDLNPEKDDSAMKAINQEYERLLEQFQFKDECFQGFSREKQSEENTFDKELRDKLDSLVWLYSLPELTLEICGAWLWIQGDTKKHKEKLKENGFFWASEKKEWYWKPSSYKRKSYRTWDKEKIRKVYGSGFYRKNSEKKEEKQEALLS